MNFLRAHRWGDLAVFDLAHLMPTLAIVDQMIRARMLADHLTGWLDMRAGKLPEWDVRPILVAGAGACGMTAAFALAEHGLDVVVIDAGSPSDDRDDVGPLGRTRRAPFGAQAACESRWIDPTQYDWPMDHWRRGIFPWNPSGRTIFPFHWTSGRAADIVRNHWLPPFLALTERYKGRVSFRWRTSIPQKDEARIKHPPGCKDAGVALSLRVPDGSLVADYFRAVVIAVGFGDEMSGVATSPDFLLITDFGETADSPRARPRPAGSGATRGDIASH